MNTDSFNKKLDVRLREFIELESHSGSLEPTLITPEYV